MNPSSFSSPKPEFTGRLGYACLNMYLRQKDIFCSRTCRLATLKKEGMDYVKDIAIRNVNDLVKLIQWNEENNIKFMRISSQLFPFASHEEVGYSVKFAENELRAAGDLAKKYGHRLTMHPGQFVQLGSPREIVIKRSILDLEHHASILDTMGLSADSIMIIHMGGVYGDKAAALSRFEENYCKLSDTVKRRLVLENDEISWNVMELLPLCERLSIPLVLDWHHDWINPSEGFPAVDVVDRINNTWYRKGIKPKQHYSEPKTPNGNIHERRAHSSKCELFPPVVGDVDLMIEAKDKEQAVFYLYYKYGLVPRESFNLKFMLPLDTVSKEIMQKEGISTDQEVVVTDVDDECDDHEADSTKKKSKKKKSKRKRVTKRTDEGEEAMEDDEDNILEKEKARRKSGKRKSMKVKLPLEKEQKNASFTGKKLELLHVEAKEHLSIVSIAADINLRRSPRFRK
ncbi:UV-endonuclease UvdE-domain-containing protein [Paraphysoderma sedebokerense]|nr:UV-endonuclease UvdE-domain-containing protein [Paraphysoderma sedebokerense]